MRRQVSAYAAPAPSLDRTARSGENWRPIAKGLLPEVRVALHEGGPAQQGWRSLAGSILREMLGAALSMLFVSLRICQSEEKPARGVVFTLRPSPGRPNRPKQLPSGMVAIYSAFFH